MEFGYESIIDTIETIKYIREVDEARFNPNEDNLVTPIVLILNRLDKGDSDRDFQHKEYLKSKFEDGANLFFDNNLVLTYLRNSYSIYNNLDSGKYFLNNFLLLEKEKEIQFYKKNIENFEYQKFIYLVNQALLKTDYTDEDIYLQDKDMVAFRNNFKKRYPDYLRYYDRYYCNKGRHRYDSFEKYCKSIKGHKKAYNDDKLVKDMAFISHTIFEYIFDKDNHIKKTMYRQYWR